MGSAFVSSPLPSPSVSRRFQVHGEAAGGPRDSAIQGSILASGTSIVKSRILDRWTLGKCFLTTAIIITVLMVYGAVALCWASGSELYIQQVTASSGARPKLRLWEARYFAGAEALGFRFHHKAPRTVALAEMPSLLFWGLSFLSPLLLLDVVHRGKDGGEAVAVRQECHLGILADAHTV